MRNNLAHTLQLLYLFAAAKAGIGGYGFKHFFDQLVAANFFSERNNVSFSDKPIQTVKTNHGVYTVVPDDLVGDCPLQVRYIGMLISHNQDRTVWEYSALHHAVHRIDTVSLHHL